ncbi:MAG: hypothetical protein H6Q54_72 [Deltaproteobacteria bacterium]|nr:hypothetical protein [Deltaproteobacteria bacterium]
MSGASDKMKKGIVVMRHFKRQSSVLVLPGYEVRKVAAECPTIVGMMFIVTHKMLESKEIL